MRRLADTTAESETSVKRASALRIEPDPLRAASGLLKKKPN